MYTRTHTHRVPQSLQTGCRRANSLRALIFVSIVWGLQVFTYKYIYDYMYMYTHSCKYVYIYVLLQYVNTSM